MKALGTVAVAASLLTLTAVAAAAQSAKATLKNAEGKDVGTAALSQTPAGVLLRLSLKGLPPGRYFVTPQSPVEQSYTLTLSPGLSGDSEDGATLQPGALFAGLLSPRADQDDFTITAARHMTYRDALALRKRNGASVFLVGLACSVIPFFAPLVGASAMTRLVRSVTSR